MRGTWTTIRRAMGIPLSALTLLVGAAGLLMDAANLLAETRTSSGGAFTSTHTGHDHRLCIQIGANAAVASHQVGPSPVWPVRTRDAEGPVPGGRPAPEQAAPSARAPPSR